MESDFQRNSKLKILFDHHNMFIHFYFFFSFLFSPLFLLIIFEAISTISNLSISVSKSNPLWALLLPKILHIKHTRLNFISSVTCCCIIFFWISSKIGADHKSKIVINFRVHCSHFSCVIFFFFFLFSLILNIPFFIIIIRAYLQYILIIVIFLFHFLTLVFFVCSFVLFKLFFGVVI